MISSLSSLPDKNNIFAGVLCISLILTLFGIGKCIVTSLLCVSAECAFLQLSYGCNSGRLLATCLLAGRMSVCQIIKLIELLELGNNLPIDHWTTTTKQFCVF